MDLEEKLQRALAIYDQKTNDGKDLDKEASWQLFINLLHIAQSHPYLTRELLLTFAETVEEEVEPRTLEKIEQKFKEELQETPFESSNFYDFMWCMESWLRCPPYIRNI